MLDDIFLGELVVVYRRDELLEFLERLPAEISAIHEEKDALSISSIRCRAVSSGVI